MLSEDASFLVLALSAIVYAAIGFFVVMFGRTRNIQLQENSMKDIHFSVFLPTFNEQNAISAKLQNLLSQTAFDRFTGEIVIYDCSTDRTTDILREFQHRDRRIRVFRQRSRTGNARTLNEAIGSTRGEIFVKTDCDSIARSSEELTRLILAFGQDENVGGVTGICVNVEREGSFRGLMTRLQVAETNLDSTLIAHSSSLVAIRRSSLKHVNPDSIAEDTEAFLNVRRQGCRAILCPYVVSTEKLPSRFADRLRQKQRRAHGIIKVLLQNADMLFNPRYGAYGMIILPLNFFLLVLSPLLLLVDACILIFLTSIAGLLTQLFLVLCFVALILSWFIGKPSWLSGLIDLQMFSFIGFLNYLTRSSSTPWEVYRE
jgi:cellulose synthase/poly-beta-1,6-N-acetylglucosamine synthase-like glycosyltransferase